LGFANCDNAVGDKFFVVMPALVAAIHVFSSNHIQDVDGPDKPGHDGAMRALLT
jgi:hypothetical protein